MKWLCVFLADLCYRCFCCRRRSDKRCITVCNTGKGGECKDGWGQVKQLQIQDGKPTFKLWMQNSLHMFNNSSVDRAEKLAKLIIERDIDCVCLCEVFDETSRGKFIDTFKGAYATAVTMAGGIKGGLNSAGEDSGLFVVSKLAMRETDVQFIKYDVKLFSKSWDPTSFNDDALANKGVLIMTYKDLSPGMPPIVVAHTHMQAWARGDAIRANQLDLCLKKLKELQQKMKPEPVIILCGDLNFTDVQAAEYIGDFEAGLKSAEYQARHDEIKAVFPQAEDCFRAKYPEKAEDGKQFENPGYTADCVVNTNKKISEEDRKRQVRERVDYIWLLNGAANAKCSKIQLEQTPDGDDFLSDHFGLCAEFSFDIPSPLRIGA